LYQGDKLLVYGGENEHREYLSDVVIFDLKTAHWTQPDIRGPIPKGRARHAAVVYEDKLFIVGGLSGETNYILDDICYLDLKTWTWSRTWSFVCRFDHTAWIWGGRLWVFGGLGTDMERGGEIWWLDLKGSPSFGISSPQSIVESPVTVSRAGQTGTSLFGHGQPLAVGASGYGGSSETVHTRIPNAGKPIAPGAISSLKFLSGPYVPSQASGAHFHALSSGALLDFVTPAGTIRASDCSLSSLELDSLRWQRLADGLEVFDPGYRWQYCTVNEDGTKAWLLGCQVDPPAGAASNFEEQLSEVLPIDLKKYGLLGNNIIMEQSSEQSRILASERHISTLPSGLGADLGSVFDQNVESVSGADFAITANADDNYLSDDETTADASSGVQSRTSVPTATSAPIQVHKIILQARWPHFRRLYAAQMAEFHTKRMHIPEPYSVVRAFLYYLYTDRISPHPEYCADLTDVAGMLVMANLYDMPKLRLLCVHRLSRELDVEHAAIIWERAGRTNEEWLKRRAASFCLTHWGRVVRTEGFRNLSRAGLMELCEAVDTEGRVVGGEELEVVGGLGGGKFGVGGVSRDGRRPRLGLSGGLLGDDMSDADADEDDGMEMS
jgi:BTB/POZ domain/Kelch motif